MKNPPVLMVLVVILGLLSAWVWATQSDGFVVARNWARNSPEIERDVGTVAHVYLVPSRYRVWSSADVSGARLSIFVTGSKRSEKVDIEAQMTRERWSVITASVGDRSLNVSEQRSSAQTAFLPGPP